jgi:hypothetical protein
MKEFSKLRTEAHADMLARKQKLLNRSSDAYKQGDLPTMSKAHSLAMKQDSRTRTKYPDEERKRVMSGATQDYANREKKLGPGKVRDSVEYSDDTNVIGEGMPASVIKNKTRNANMSDSEFAEAHKDKSDNDLKSMAHRHGYGKDSTHYIDKRKKGKSSEIGLGEGERGLWDNIHAKRKRIKAGSGERMRKPGSKGAPTAKALRVSAEAVENVLESSDHHYDDAQEHLAKANTAEKVGKEMDFHGHMADHHDSLSQWHESKGRGVSADKHAGKSEEHSERYTELANGKPSKVKEGIMDFMSNTPAKPKSRLSLSAMRDISRRMDTKNKMPKVSRASNDTENPNASFRLVRAEEKDDAPFDGPYTSSFKKPNNPNRTGMDSARSLAQRAMDQANKKKPTQDLARARKVNMGEEKDEQEYGYEGDMALNQLATLIRCADMIKELLKPDTDLPEWVQSKITLATDYIQTAADYMYSEMKEEVEHTDESRQVYYINSHKNQDPAVAQAKRLKNKMSKPKMLNLKMGESYSARNRLVLALDKEKKKREDHEAAQAAREAAAQAKTPPPEEKIKEGIASLISKNIKRVTATKPTPQQKADIRLNK